VTLAREQHAAYCATLRAAGLELLELLPDDAYPDGPFVQDTAVVYGDMAVIARFGVESREGEQTAVRQALLGQKRLAEIQPPATLEGGDVLHIGRRVYAGLSARTNHAGFAQLRDWLEPEGATVLPLQVLEGLHLLSECTYLGQGVLLATDVYRELSAFSGLDVIRVPPHEAPAANALALGDAVVLPASFPETAKRILERGFQVLPLSLTEFAKADGGVTCLSLLF
jgi:dimethylargininase